MARALLNEWINEWMNEWLPGIFLFVFATTKQEKELCNFLVQFYETGRNQTNWECMPIKIP